MCQCLGEENRSAGRAGDGAHERLQRVGLAPVVGVGKVAFVAAWHTTGAAVAGVDVVQVIRHHGQPIEDAPVVEVVVLRRVERRCAAVQSCADRPLAAADDVGIHVVEPELAVDKRLKVGRDGGLIDHRAIGWPPVEQPAEAVR